MPELLAELYILCPKWPPKKMGTIIEDSVYPGILLINRIGQMGGCFYCYRNIIRVHTLVKYLTIGGYKDDADAVIYSRNHIKEGLPILYRVWINILLNRG
jgi:hypothetical protein